MGLLRVLPTVLALTLCLRGAFALRFYLNNGERQCFTFEADSNALMHGTALAEAGAGSPELDVQVKSTAGNPAPIYSGRLRGASKFSFRTPAVAHHLDREGGEYDDFDDEEEDEDPGAIKAAYSACVKLLYERSAEHDGSKRAVTFHVRPAVQRDTSDVAAGERSVKGVQLAMRQMHETLGQLTKDISILQKRERKLLKRNKKVSSRVVSLAVLAIFVLCCTAALQVVYFMSFFKQKKLL